MLKLQCMIIGTIVLATSGVLARGPDVTAEEYSLYHDWNSGRADPRLQKFSDEIKMKKIAKNLGVKPADIKSAIVRVEPVLETVLKDTEKSIRESLAETPLKGRVQKVQVLDAEGHVVVFVKWRCGDKRDADKEASHAGWAIADGGSVVKTVGVWCVNELDIKLFSAKASRVSLARINKSAISRFASSRYIRLFEGVKRGPHK